jgi:predicted lipid-binding transport protein (Tim44 family)
MRKTSNLFVVLTMLGAAAAFTVSVADARPGGGKSSGSRGAQTHSAPAPTATAPGGAQQMQRTVTPAAPAAQPGVNAARPAAAPAAQPQNSMARTMMMGLGAGLLGAGLFGLLSGSGFFAGLGSLAGLFGFLLQIALIGGVIYLVMRLIRGRNTPAMATAQPAMERMTQAQGAPRDAMQRQAMGAMGGGYGQPAVQPLNLTGDDFNSFEKLLGDIQTAYGREDIATLRALSTPEMASYLEGDLSDNQAKGLVNRIGNIKLLQGDLSEAWREPSAEYATVAMRYAISDAMVDRATGRVVDGDMNAVQEVVEIWSFTREPGQGVSDWKLSAIQQAA